jgi:hypothetical protein
MFIVLIGANNSLRIIGTSGITQMIRNQTVFDIPTACLHGAVVSISNRFIGSSYSFLTLIGTNKNHNNRRGNMLFNATFNNSLVIS